MVELEPANPAQMPLFSSLEQDPDTAPYILPTTLEQHRQDFAREDIVYLSIYEDGDLGGYMILALDPDGVSVEFRRIVVAHKNRGTGQQAIPAMEAYCRDRLRRSRVWLDVYDFNQRGRHLYARLGYRLFDQQAFQGKLLLLYEKFLLPE